MGVEFASSINRIGGRRLAVEIRRILVYRPLGHIAIDVMKAPGIGFFGTDYLRGLLAVARKPGIVA